MKLPAHNYNLYINLQQLGEGVGGGLPCNIQLLYIIFLIGYDLYVLPQTLHRIYLSPHGHPNDHAFELL